MKTLLEKEKMLVTSIFSLFHNVFYSSQNKVRFFCNIYFLPAKSFKLDWSKILSLGKELKVVYLLFSFYLIVNFMCLPVNKLVSLKKKPGEVSNSIFK